MGKYDGVENEEARAERLPKLGVGEFLLEVQVNKPLQTRKGPTILSEFKVLESTNPDHTPGTSASLMFYESDEMFLSKLAAYARALTGLKKVTGPDVEDMISEENPLAGFKVKVRVESDTAKKSGRPYKKYTWRHVPGNPA